MGDETLNGHADETGLIVLKAAAASTGPRRARRRGAILAGLYAAISMLVALASALAGGGDDCLAKPAPGRSRSVFVTRIEEEAPLMRPAKAAPQSHPKELIAFDPGAAPEKELRDALAGSEVVAESELAPVPKFEMPSSGAIAARGLGLRHPRRIGGASRREARSPRLAEGAAGFSLKKSFAGDSARGFQSRAFSGWK